MKHGSVWMLGSKGRQGREARALNTSSSATDNVSRYVDIFNSFSGKTLSAPWAQREHRCHNLKIAVRSLENLSLTRSASEAVLPPQNASQVKNMNKWEVRELILHCICSAHAVELGSYRQHTETSSSPKAFGIRHCCPVSWVMDRHIKLAQSVGSSSLESVLTCHSGQHKLQVLRKAPFHRGNNLMGKDPQARNYLIWSVVYCKKRQEVSWWLFTVLT